MIKLGNPVPIFLDATGGLADGGSIYVGTANADPQLSPITVYWDPALTIIAQQPLQTMGGLIVNGATPASVFTAATDYSMRMIDANDNLVFYSPSVFTNANAFQPIDADLSAIAALGTTPFGRSLLTLANMAALAQATGLPPALPLAGGTMLGNILRQGSGVHAYWSDPGMTGGRLFITAASAADPTSQPGDVWFQY